MQTMWIYHGKMKFKKGPSNYPVAIKIKKNNNHIESKHLIKGYNDVFYQQESEGIIEKKIK